jgi:hypothetical protein
MIEFPDNKTCSYKIENEEEDKYERGKDYPED